MTITQMVSLMAEMQSLDLNNSVGPSPTTEQSVRQLNWAQRVVGREVRHFAPKLTFDLQQDVFEYNLFTCCTKRVLRPSRVWVLDEVLRKPDRTPGFWTLADLENHNPNWITEASDVPVIACWAGSNQLILYPPPNTDTATETNHFMSGEMLHEDMDHTTPNNQCPSHPDLHEAICAVAVILSAMPAATERIEWERLNVYDNGKYSQAIRQIASENRARRLQLNSHRINPGRRFIYR